LSLTRHRRRNFADEPLDRRQLSFRQARGDPLHLRGERQHRGYASVVVRFSRRGPVQGYVAYAGAVLWALVAVVANQYDASGVTSLAVALGVVPVALALLAPLRARGPQGARTAT